MTEAYVLGSGILNASQAPMAEGEPGVTPPPPTQDFIIDLSNEFVVDLANERLITV